MRLKITSEGGARWRWLFWETLIIVLGVLIAFAVNDYWSGRQDRELELQYLKRIYADLKSDESWVTLSIENTIPSKMAALDSIAPVVRGLRPVPEDVEQFVRNVAIGGRGGASPSYFVTATTFEDMKATGNLRLIRDAELRSKINAYYVGFDNNHTRLLARTTGYFMFVHSIFPAEKRQNIDTELIQKFDVQRAVEKILSPEFQDLLNQEYNFAYFMEDMYRRYASYSADLAKEVDAQIRKLERR